jgi:hypothetical protein
MKALKGEEMTGTDAEACAYLYTRSLVSPMDSDWTNIYLHTAGRVSTRWNKTEMPPDIRVEQLTGEQGKDLARLKEWLYRKRVESRQERDRAERKQQKETEAAQAMTEQPALFSF